MNIYACFILANNEKASPNKKIAYENSSSKNLSLHPILKGGLQKPNGVVILDYTGPRNLTLIPNHH